MSDSTLSSNNIQITSNNIQQSYYFMFIFTAIYVVSAWNVYGNYNASYTLYTLITHSVS